jgi:hypothetical protein
MPEASYRICADYYLSNVPALFGKVGALETVGGCYRVHASNNHHSTALDLAQTRRIILQTCETHRHLQRTAEVFGLPGFSPDATAVPAVSFLANRLISRRLDPGRHPIRGDTAWGLGLRGVRAAFGRFDLNWPARVARAGWFAATAVAPRPLVNWLAQKYLYPAAA